MSGPAGGVKGAADVITRSTPYKNLITLDMGGTSTDCAVIYKGQPQLRRETVVGNLSIRAPAVDVKTVGAGGGSITSYMELTETLRVGPESADAQPGPACHGKGERQATVTDANLVLGCLPKTLLGGEFELDVNAAMAAVTEIADQMKLPIMQTAEDIITIINETMYGALRLVSVEQGYDPREFALVAFGGAGPLHANAVGQLLGAWPVIIPPSPGILCAQGDVTTKMRHEQSATFIHMVSETIVDEVRKQYNLLEQQGRETLQRSAGDSWPGSWKAQYQADLRYKGQALTITVDLDADELALDTPKWHDLLRDKFDRQHQQMFTYCLADFELELMRLGVVLEDSSPSIEIPEVSKSMTVDPPPEAKIGEQKTIVQGKEQLATLWDRQKITQQGSETAAPGTVINDGFHDLIDVSISQGSVLKPVRPAPFSCRTHLMGRTLDIVQALIGQKDDAYQAAAGFSDSPHFFYSGFKATGEWYQLYQIGFGGVPARQAGDGPDCHCLFPAIKSIPTESIELNYPLRIEANESVADSGGPGFFRGGNAQRTLYRFLARGEFSLHDDRWFTKPWGLKGGKPGQRSRKVLYRYSRSAENPPMEILPSKCDHIRVDPGDLLEWITWGGGGLGDPLTRPAEKVALEVRRKLVTVDGARKGYGVVLNNDLGVSRGETEELRAQMRLEQARLEDPPMYDRGGDIEALRQTCLQETGLEPPVPQWETDLYGPHCALKYVKDWFEEMTVQQGWKLE
ncbi:hypothetical protein N7486_004465 [Penicillium sp. IBT 16267x]|nr:hypothetical protein N7486_004465 [Penicillium sp. IBT 16267x]